MNLRMQEFVNYLNFNASDERTIRYLKGETLTAAEEEAADGLVTNLCGWISAWLGAETGRSA